MVKGLEVFALERGTTVYYPATVVKEPEDNRVIVQFHGGKMRNLKLFKRRQCDGTRYTVPSVIRIRCAENSDDHKIAAAHFREIQRNLYREDTTESDVPSDDDADSDFVPSQTPNVQSLNNNLTHSFWTRYEQPSGPQAESTEYK